MSKHFRWYCGRCGHTWTDDIYTWKKCANCGKRGLWVTGLGEIVNQPAPRPPCKWHNVSSEGWNYCMQDGCAARKTCPDACEYYEPQVAEKRVAGMAMPVMLGGYRFDAIFHDEIGFMSEYNKEDNDMSGNAYFCDSCRGTFPVDEVHMTFVSFEQDTREGETITKDKVRRSYICTACYVKFREVVEPFHFPWDEWRKGDDDE